MIFQRATRGASSDAILSIDVRDAPDQPGSVDATRPRRIEMTTVMRWILKPSANLLAISGMPNRRSSRLFSIDLLERGPNQRYRGLGAHPLCCRHERGRKRGRCHPTN